MFLEWGYPKMVGLYWKLPVFGMDDPNDLRVPGSLKDLVQCNLSDFLHFTPGVARRKARLRGRVHLWPPTIRQIVRSRFLSCFFSNGCLNMFPCFFPLFFQFPRVESSTQDPYFFFTGAPVRARRLGME